MIYYYHGDSLISDKEFAIFLEKEGYIEFFSLKQLKIVFTY